MIRFWRSQRPVAPAARTPHCGAIGCWESVPWGESFCHWHDAIFMAGATLEVRPCAAIGCDDAARFGYVCTFHHFEMKGSS